MQSSVHPSLHANLHHQTVFAKFTLTIVYPSPYKRLVWHITKHIQILLNERFNYLIGKKVFIILTWINRFLFSSKRFFGNFIPHKTITCNQKDPPWIDKEIKTLIAEKNALYKRLKRRMLNSKLLDKLDALQGKTTKFNNFFSILVLQESRKIIIWSSH